MAVGALEVLDNLGLSVPNDLSILSMDGFNLAEIHDIPLSSVHVLRDELCPEALRLLQQRLSRPDAPPVPTCCWVAGWLSGAPSSVSAAARCAPPSAPAVMVCTVTDSAPSLQGP